MEQYEDGHLGGCVKGGDPATFYPGLWTAIIEDFGIKSILDIGCGEGHSLEYFNSKGIQAIGLEGCEEPINNSKVKNLIIKHDFTTGPYLFNNKESFDAIWCCEFLEHVDAQYEKNIFDTIYFSQAKYLFITHAVPGQGGYNHVNLQNASYWINKLAPYRYKLRAKSTRICKSLCFFEPINPITNHFYNNGLVFVREDLLEKEKPESNSAIITWASGKEFCKNPGIKVYVNSLNNCFNGHKIVFTHDMDIDTREYFEQNNFEIIDADPNNCKWLVRDRFLEWFKYLSKTNYHYVGLFDCKDVVFQENPLFTCCGLALISEGKLHSDCDWNTKDQSCLRSGSSFSTEPFSYDPVICAGTILGEQEYVKNLCLNIWSGTSLSGKCTDQAVLNYLYKFAYKGIAALIDPIFDNICLTANLPKSHPPIIKDGVFCNSLTGKPYQIYHQYDRVPENKKIIYERYLNE